jgi:L-fucose isomerase-like protein
MLNASYNVALRNLRPYIPEYPVGTASEIAGMIADFQKIARIILGLSALKILTFGPRPQDFFACNGPIKGLFDLGVEIMENSELDLFADFNKHENDSRIPALVQEMAAELGEGNCYPGILPRLAQYELTLEDWMSGHLGLSKYAAFANKCWPAFQTEFGFVPCYVNSRLTGSGIPVSCEVDIYGAFSEYIGACVSGAPVTLLDINRRWRALHAQLRHGGRARDARHRLARDLRGDARRAHDAERRRLDPDASPRPRARAA